MADSEILEELKSYTEKFPMKAVKAAIEQREAVAPELLRELEEAAANGGNGMVGYISPGADAVELLKR